MFSGRYIPRQRHQQIASLNCSIQHLGQQTDEWTDLYILDDLDSLYYTYRLQFGLLFGQPCKAHHSSQIVFLEELNP